MKNTLGLIGLLLILNSGCYAQSSGKYQMVNQYSGFSAPTGITTDAVGNIYVANWSGGSVTKIDMHGKQSVFAQNLGAPAGLAFDRAGNLYIADYTNDIVQKVDSTGKTTAFAVNLHTPTGITFSANGNLLVANRGSHEIVSITPKGKQTLIATGLKTPVGVVENQSGALFVTNYGGDISKFFGGELLLAYNADFNRPGVGITTNSRDEVFAVDNGSGCIRRIKPDGTSEIVIEGVDGCVALHIDENDVIYVGGWGQGIINIYVEN